VRQKLIGVIQLFRPELPFAAGVCVVLGEIIALGKFPSLQHLRSQTPEEGRFFMRRIYLVALFGMLAFILGQFFA